MQRRFWNWKDDDLTIDISQWLIGLIDSGRFRGFDPILNGGMSLVLNHNTSGATRVDKTGSLIGKFGVLSTKQGIIVQEYDTISLPVPTTPAGFYRKGVVVFTHEYVEITGGQEGVYSLIMSADIPIGEASAFPPLPNEPFQTILGYLTIPQNCTSLTDPDVVYVQGSVPSFANQADFIEKSNGFFLTSLDARNNKIVNLKTCEDPLDAANKFYVDKSIADAVVFATEQQRGIAKLATVADAETFTDDQKIITPLKWFKAWIKSIASQAEANEDTVSNKAITPKTLGNRTATETRKGVARIATVEEAIAGTDDTTIITPYKLKKAMPLTPVVLALVDWNIQANNNITVMHELGADWDKIVALDLSIRDDANGVINKGITVRNEFTADEFAVNLQLDTTGFDLANYNATGFTRGYVTLWMKLDIPPVAAFLDVDAGADQTVNSNQPVYGSPVLRKVTKTSLGYPVAAGTIQAIVDMGINTTFGGLKIQFQSQDGQWVDLTAPNEVTLVGSNTRSIKGKVADTLPSSGSYPIRAEVIISSTIFYSNILIIDLNSAVGTIWEDNTSTSTLNYAAPAVLTGYVSSFGSALASVLWSVIDSPVGSNPIIENPTSLQAIFKSDTFGVYTVQLEATSVDSLVASDTVLVTLGQADNQPPVITWVLSAAAVEDSIETSTPVPMYGWYKSSVAVIATDPNGDTLNYQIVEVMSFDPASNTIGPVMANSDVFITQGSSGNFTLKQLRAVSTNGMPVNLDGSRWYYFKAVASDGRGGVVEKGFRVLVKPNASSSQFTLSFTPDTNPDSKYYDGSVLLSSIFNVASLKLTLSGPVGSKVQIGSNVYFAGTTLISQHIANSIPINLYSGNGTGTATAIFKAYNLQGNLLGQGTVEATGTGLGLG